MANPTSRRFIRASPWGKICMVLEFIQQLSANVFVLSFVFAKASFFTCCLLTTHLAQKMGSILIATFELVYRLLKPSCDKVGDELEEITIIVDAPAPTESSEANAKEDPSEDSSLQASTGDEESEEISDINCGDDLHCYCYHHRHHYYNYYHHQQYQQQRDASSEAVDDLTAPRVSEQEALEATHSSISIDYDSDSGNSGSSEAATSLPILVTNYYDSPSFQQLYQVGHVLGDGEYGTVYMCTEIASGRRYACKAIDKEENDSRSIVNEAEAMRAMRGRAHVVDLVNVFEDPSTVYLVMEYCGGKTLKDLILKKGRFCEEDARDIFRQLVHAVATCHASGFVHGDIKPENIFLAQPPENGAVGHARCKLGDFGLARRIPSLDGDAFITGWYGTFNYSPPESYMFNKFGASSDLFALGCILYEMLYCNFAFPGEEEEEIGALVMSMKVDYEHPEADFTLSEPASSLLRRLLTYERERASLTEILEHPFLR